MKTTQIVLALTVAVVTACSSDDGPTTTTVAVTTEVQAAMTAAIQDEYHAEETYLRVLADFGNTLPFYNVVYAEQRHSASLAALFERRGLPVPVSIWHLNNVPRFASVAAACAGAAGAEVANIRATRQRLSSMDMAPFDWEQPDGYPDRISWWSGLATQRWNWATYISTQNNVATVRVDVATKYRAPVNSADGVMDQINIRMFGGEMPASLRASLRAYLVGGTFSDARVRETLALAASSQEFQWY